MTLVVVERHVSQSLVALEGVDGHGHSLPRIDDRLQLRQMSAVLLLSLELEDGLGQAVIHPKR